MNKERIVINDNYVLPEPEKIEKVILVLGNGGPYIMIHCEKTSFRINLVNLNCVDGLHNLDVLGDKLERIKYEGSAVRFITSGLIMYCTEFN